MKIYNLKVGLGRSILRKDWSFKRRGGFKKVLVKLRRNEGLKEGAEI